MSNQYQKSGAHSTNLQVGELNISNGLSYTEAKEIALDVFNANFHRLSKIAHEVAEQRVIELTDDFLSELIAQKVEISGLVNDPGFQYVLFEAQKHHARNGNSEAKLVLIDLLVRRLQCNDSLTKVICDEAISTIPKLTRSQLKALAIIYVLTAQAPNSVANSVTEHLYNFIYPLINETIICPADFEHLLYTGCCNQGAQKKRLADIYQNAFPHEFTSHDSNGYIIQQCPEIRPSFPLWHSRGFCELSLTSVGKYLGKLMVENDLQANNAATSRQIERKKI